MHEADEAGCTPVHTCRGGLARMAATAIYCSAAAAAGGIAAALRQGMGNTPSMGDIRIGPAVIEQAIICIPFPRTA